MNLSEILLKAMKVGYQFRLTKQRIRQRLKRWAKSIGCSVTQLITEKSYHPLIKKFLTLGQLQADLAVKTAQRLNHYALLNRRVRSRHYKAADFPDFKSGESAYHSRREVGILNPPQAWPAFPISIREKRADPPVKLEERVEDFKSAGFTPEEVKEFELQAILRDLPSKMEGFPAKPTIPQVEGFIGALSEVPEPYFTEDRLPPKLRGAIVLHLEHSWRACKAFIWDNRHTFGLTKSTAKSPEFFADTRPDHPVALLITHIMWYRSKGLTYKQ
jgi:hypothetical protein